MRIFLIATNYWPEPTGLAVYTTDFAKTLQDQGHLVTVLTSLPHYPWWKVPDEFAHVSEGSSLHNDILIFRVNHFIPRKMNALLRMRFEASLWWNLLKATKKLIGNKYDLVVAYIPTVSAGIVGKRVAKKLGIPFGLIVQDLSSIGARQSGIRGGLLISRIAHCIEKKALLGATKLIVISSDMHEIVLSQGVPKERVETILNYTSTSLAVVDKNYAKKSFGWKLSDFVVIHAGNMGAKQDLANVVKASDSLHPESNVKIVLVGHGNQETYLKKLCLGKRNITVLPAVSDSDYSMLLSSADLLLVNERSSQMGMSLPSKLTSYLYCERPVIAAVPRDGATWKFLDGLAELVEAGNPVALARAIERLSKQPERLKDLARRGKNFADENLVADIGRMKYLLWVSRLVETK